MSEDNFKKKICSPVIWGNLLGMLIFILILIIGVYQGLAMYTQHGKEVEVPNVTGKLPADALYLLETQGLSAEITDSTYDRSMPPGVIVVQKPTQGSHVKEGRNILLTINSTSSPTIILPDIAGNCSVREAKDRLKQMGLNVLVEEISGEKEFVYNVKCNGRIVYNGDRVPCNATITLQVGRGYDRDTLEADEDDIYTRVTDAIEGLFDYE